MYIKLTKIDNDAEISGYDAIEVTGKQLDNGKTWSKSFFANNGNLVGALDEFGVGEDVNVVMEKKGKFWNIKDFKEMTDADYEQVGGGGSKKRSTGGSGKGSTGSLAKSDGMSKEEWAEKDRITRMSIAKSVALKEAVNNLKEGATAAAVLKRANEYLPYLLDLDDSPFVEAKDALDPPEDE
jgi:hypothetical protein